jgi:hypothetical protein
MGRALIQVFLPKGEAIETVSYEDGDDAFDAFNAGISAMTEARSEGHS